MPRLMNLQADRERREIVPGSGARHGLNTIDESRNAVGSFRKTQISRRSKSTHNYLLLPAMHQALPACLAQYRLRDMNDSLAMGTAQMQAGISADIVQ